MVRSKPMGLSPLSNPGTMLRHYAMDIFATELGALAGMPLEDHSWRIVAAVNGRASWEGGEQHRVAEGAGDDRSRRAAASAGDGIGGMGGG